MASSAHRNPYEYQSNESISLRISNPKLSLSVNHDRRIIILLFISPIWILLFTAIPIFVNFHGVAADIYRFLEPIVSLPLQYFIMISSEVFIDDTQGGRNFLFRLTERSFLNIWFLVGAATYAQGAGIHSTAIMAKNALRDVMSSRPEIVQQYPELNDVLAYYRTTLEHTTGHYLYAIGYVIITWTQLFAYRRQKHDGIESLKGKLWWIAGGLLFGLLNASVAIEFPHGSLVILIYLIVIALPLSFYLFKSNMLFSNGRRLLLQTYLIGYVTAMVIVVIWIAAVGGFKDRDDVGLSK